MPVISRKNEKPIDLINNEEFTIQSITKEHIIVTSEDKTIEILHQDFQKLFFVAFCITIHSSQGCTFNEPYTIYEWDRLGERLKYVALSRSSNLGFINVV